MSESYHRKLEAHPRMEQSMGWYEKEQVSKPSEGRGMVDSVVLDQVLSAFHLVVTKAPLFLS